MSNYKSLKKSTRNFFNLTHGFGRSWLISYVLSYNSSEMRSLKKNTSNLSLLKLEQKLI